MRFLDFVIFNLSRKNHFDCFGRIEFGQLNIFQVLKTSEVRKILCRKGKTDCIKLFSITVGEAVTVFRQFCPCRSCKNKKVFLATHAITSSFFGVQLYNKSPAGGRALIKRFHSIRRIYSACGYRITHNLALQQAVTEPVHCFNATIAGQRRYPLTLLYHRII